MLLNGVMHATITYDFLKAGLDILLPRVCGLCGSVLDLRETPAKLCHFCLASLPGTSKARCGRCAQSHLGPCLLERERQFPWAWASAWLDYSYPVDAWIHALKFRKQAPLAHAMGWGLAEHIWRDKASRDHLLQAKLLCAVPISLQRYAERGFNQADLIAQGMSACMREKGHRISLSRCLHRLSKPKVSSSTKIAHSLLSAPERKQLPESEFVVREPRKSSLRQQQGNTCVFQGKTVLLVDDVMTTGSTLAASTQALLHAGATQVMVCCVARTALA